VREKREVLKYQANTTFPYQNVDTTLRVKQRATIDTYVLAMI
jgi:hypothetical protein